MKHALVIRKRQLPLCHAILEMNALPVNAGEAENRGAKLGTYFMMQPR